MKAKRNFLGQIAWFFRESPEMELSRADRLVFLESLQKWNCLRQTAWFFRESPEMELS